MLLENLNLLKNKSVKAKLITESWDPYRVFNRHLMDFRANFTIEFDVKSPNTNEIDTDISKYEFETGEFANFYGDSLYNEILEKLPENDDWYISDWSFAGRSNGWYALLCNGNQESVTKDELYIIQDIVNKYWDNYNRELNLYYS